MSQVIAEVLPTSIPWFLLVAGLILTTLIDPYINRKNRKLLLIFTGLLLLLMLAEITDYITGEIQINDFIRTCAGALGYAIRPFLLVLSILLLYSGHVRWFHWALAGVNAVVYFISIFTGIAFGIRENHHFYDGPLYFLCYLVCGLLIADLLVLVIRISYRKRKVEAVLVLFAVGLIIVSTAVDFSLYTQSPLNYLTKGIIGSVFFYFIWLHIQLARQHEAESIAELRTEHRIQLMVSQIQPHFLYNTLSTIQALCRTDPEKAFDMTERFGRYLRQNLDSLNQAGLIPFEQEIEHTRIYAEIEQVRFPSIHIAYDLQDTNFTLPVLTVQPLVENAIRHGVRIRKNGEIMISSRREEAAHVVTIRDNGAGFDVEAALNADSHHIGLRNVKERVEQMCSGTMEIDSRIHEGTTITLRFPAGKEQG